MDYEDDYFDEMDEEGGQLMDYFDEDDMSPEMADMLEAYREGRGGDPVEYGRISVWEMVDNCVLPTSLQMVQGLFSLIVMSFIFRLVAQLRRAGQWLWVGVRVCVGWCEGVCGLV